MQCLLRSFHRVTSHRISSLQTQRRSNTGFVETRFGKIPTWIGSLTLGVGTAGSLFFFMKRFQTNHVVDLYLADAMVLESEGHHEMALEAYNECLALTQSRPSLFFFKGRALYKLRRYEESVEAYSEVIKRDPKIDKAYHNKAVALEALGRRQEALDQLELALKINPAYKGTYDEMNLRLSHK